MAKSKKSKAKSRTAITRTGRWKIKFLASLAETDNVTLSCKVSGVDPKTAYKHRENDKEFAAAWVLAMESAADVLELEARRRAVEGVLEPYVYEGQVAGQYVDPGGKPCDPAHPGARFEAIMIRKYSDGLLQFLLRGSRPKKYRERVDVRHGIDDGPRTAAEGETEAAEILAAVRKRFGVKAGGAASD